MAKFGIHKLVYVLIVTSATTGLVTGLQPYLERTLGDEKICHPLGSRKNNDIHLSNEGNASLIVKHSHIWKTWHPLCKFVVRAAKGQSLMASIQNMYLRTDGSHCLDYIMFRRKDRHWKKICGHIDRSRAVFRIIENQSSNLEGGMRMESTATEEYDSEGEIETTIVLSTPRPKDEALDLTVVYTVYSGGNCTEIFSHPENYREIPLTNIHQICIRKEFFCDGYQNCVSVLCRDEEGCPEPTDIVSNGTGTKVTIAAVTTMFLCFIIFVMGLWICRKNQKLCWSSDCAGPGAHDIRLPRTEREVEDVAHRSIAVSPMLEVAVLPSGLDKDLPPSYDSLFPEQSIPSAT